MILSIAWITQGVSGAWLGLESLYINGDFPETDGIAQAASYIKITCVSIGLILTLFTIWRDTRTTEKMANITMSISFMPGAITLGSAAFLRWLS